jgi:diacylglycerol kinase (ATP)
MQQQRFSIRKRAKSFYYAGTGIRRFLKSEHNARIHLAATLAVVIAALVLKVSRLEASALASAIGLVWVTEMLNTCLERAMDLLSTERRPEIGFVKDLAAGAVLVASVTALVIGLFIFIPHIL